jgi:protein RecA
VAKSPPKGPRSLPRRTPVGVGKPTGKEAKRLKVDPIAEYQAMLREKVKGSDGKLEESIVEAITLADEDCLSAVRMRISTQSMALDRLLGGGLPTGRLTEVYGANHIGKSTLLDHVFASVQKIGGIAVLGDTEAARDEKYTTALGVDVAKLQYLDFDRGTMSMEAMLNTVLRTIDFFATKFPDTPVVIGWDSLGGTATDEEIGKPIGDRTVASAAKVLRGACRQITTRLGGTKIALVVLNHQYDKINAGGFGVGPKRETYGGEAIRHAASVRIELFNLGFIKAGEGAPLGREVGVKLHKNRLGNPFGEAVFALLSGVGIDNTWTLFDSLKRAHMIKLSGSWAAINIEGEVHQFQGFQGLAEKVREHPDLFNKLVRLYATLPDNF